MAFSTTKALNAKAAKEANYAKTIKIRAIRLFREIRVKKLNQ